MSDALRMETRRAWPAFAGFTRAAIAVQQHTADIPVVFAGVSDASQIGAASQFNRPEHNFTGLINMNRELVPKRLEILKEAIPGLSVVGYLANPNYGLHKPQLQDMEAAAKRLGVTLVVAEVSNPAGLEGTFDQLTTHGAQGVVVSKTLSSPPRTAVLSPWQRRSGCQRSTRSGTTSKQAA